MKHPSDDSEIPRDAEHLFDILDGLIEAENPTPANLDDAEPVPLSEGSVDRALDRIRRIKAERLARPVAPRRTRMAALLPIAISVFLLAAVPVYFFAWSGRNSSTELAYEDALEIVFDGHYPDVERHSAYSHVAISIKVGVTAIKECAQEVSSLQPKAVAVLAELMSACQDTGSVQPGPRYPSGHFSTNLETIQLGRKGDYVVQAQAFDEFVKAALAGIEVLHRGRAVSPKFEQTFESQLGKLKRRLIW